MTRINRNTLETIAQLVGMGLFALLIFFAPDVALVLCVIVLVVVLVLAFYIRYIDRDTSNEENS